MVRILQLQSTSPDFQAQRTAATLRQHAGTEYSITSHAIGRGGGYRNWVFAFFSLRSNRAEKFDVIQAFDFPTLKASIGQGNVIFSPSCLPDPYSIRWIKSQTRKVPVEIVCNSAAEQRVYLVHGIPAECCHVIAPAIESSPLKPLRTALGFAETDHVIILPGETNRRSGHHAALWTVSILHVLYPNCRALLWGPGDIEPLARLSQKLHQPNLLTIAERKLGRRVDFEELPSVADMSLLSPLGPIPLMPLAHCMQAGLPIVATASPWLADLLQDARNAALVDRPTPRMMAQRIMELQSDPVLSSSIASAARQDANQLFRANEIVSKYRPLYEKIATRANANSSPPALMNPTRA